MMGMVLEASRVDDVVCHVYKAEACMLFHPFRHVTFGAARRKKPMSVPTRQVRCGTCTSKVDEYLSARDGNIKLTSPLKPGRSYPSCP